jgi:hypothetical protein
VYEREDWAVIMQQPMQLEFVSVEQFYFALTLAVRTLEDFVEPGLAEKVGSLLAEKFEQASTVAAASQTTYSYVFRVKDIDNSPNPQLIVSISDWQGNLRLSSDFGWTLDDDRKPIRTEKFEQRGKFTQQIKEHLHQWLQISF